jgi:transcriptional regulator with XRE-family HTH domain
MNAERIRQARESKKLSREFIANAVGVSGRQFWRYEAGESIPPANILGKIAEVLAVSTDYLLGLEQTKMSEPSSLSAKTRAFVLRYGRTTETVLVATPTEIPRQDVQKEWVHALRHTARGLELPDYDAAIKLMSDRHPDWMIVKTQVQDVEYDPDIETEEPEVSNA